MPTDNSDLRSDVGAVVQARRGSTGKTAAQLITNVLKRAQGEAPGEVGYRPPSVTEAAEYNKALLKSYDELTKAVESRGAGRDTILQKKLEMARHMLNYAIGHLKEKMKQGTKVEVAKLQQKVKAAEQTIDTMDIAIDRLVPGMKKGGTKLDPDKVIADFTDKLNQQGVSAPTLIHKTLMKGKTPQEVDELYVRMQGTLNVPHLKDALGDVDQTVLKAAVDHAKELRAEGALTATDLAGMALDEEGATALEAFISPAGRQAHWSAINEQIQNTFATTGGDIHPMIAQMSQALAGDPSVTTIPEALSSFGGDPKQQAAADQAYADDVKLDKANILDKMQDPNASGPILQAKINLIQNPAFLQKQREVGIMNAKVMLKALARGYRQEERQERQQSVENMQKFASNPGAILSPVHKTIESARESLAATARSKPASSAPGAQMLSKNIEDINEKTGVT